MAHSTRTYETVLRLDARSKKGRTGGVIADVAEPGAGAENSIASSTASTGAVSVCDAVGLRS